MKITEISLRRPVTVLIITIATVIFGAYSYMNMGVERMPNVEFPIVVVRTTLEGASPAIVDNDVTDVLESRINTIEGIKSMSSSSYEGRTVIVVEFELDRQALAFWDTQSRGWKVNPGEYTLSLGTSSADIAATLPVSVK